MKIERVNENQIKIQLDSSDLNHRDIKLTELAYGSEKTQELFQEMMAQAMEECGFEAHNVPLMIEAIPLSSDCITIIVTKVTNIETLEERFSKFPGLAALDELRKLAPFREGLRQSQEDKRRKHSRNKTKAAVFSINSLDEAALLSTRLNGLFYGSSRLYKMNNRYFLYLINDNPADRLTLEDIEAIGGEYGVKQNITDITPYHLAEHGESLIPEGACFILSEYLAK